MKISFLILIVISLLSCSNEPTDHVDLVLINGNFITLDESKPSAQAIAISADRIIYIGTDVSIKKIIGKNTRLIDLQGMTAIPGLIESHAHLLSLGYFKINLDLTNMKNFDNLITAVKNKIRNSKPGEWIYGRGWHQEDWGINKYESIDGYPVHTELSRISPDNPVILKHRSGHAIMANAKAMVIAGINKRTKNPDGGKIIRFKDGTPTGIFIETAEDLIYDYYSKYKKGLPPEVLETERNNAVELAVSECLSYGITTFHDAGAAFDVIDLYKKLADENKLGMRLWVMIGEDNSTLKRKINSYKFIGYANNFLTVRAIKQYIDGALGSRGAWLFEPYNDMPSTFGLNVNTNEYLQESANIAIESDFQLCIHAIGDRANHEVLNLYEMTFHIHPEKKNLRWRIEHTQHLTPEDIPKFKKLGVIAAMQPIHCISDGPWVEKRIGTERASEGAYIWRKLIDNGCTIGCGTDAPVESVNPFMNIYAAVTRKMANGKEFYPSQKMTRIEALKCYTINNAYAAFEENIKGSLKRGKLADIAVLSKNILKIPAEEIKDIKVLYTILGGKIAYKAR